MDIVHKNPLISVIVPVFNAGVYLEQCILSILNQSLKEIEVIAVNDGSTDKSGEILDKIAQQDSRLYVYHRENKGVSAARNFGINNAKGACIGFVDADDWIEPNMYEKMYYLIKRENADLIICNVNELKENGVFKRLDLINESIDFTNNGILAFSDLMRFKYDYSNWNKLYSRKVIAENSLRFDEGIKVYEDLLFNCCYFIFSNKALVLSDAYYNYRIHIGSVMNKKEFIQLDEFVKLYKSFHKNNLTTNNKNIINVFNKEIFRIYYYNLIPSISNSIKKNKSSFFQKVRILQNQLKKAEIQIRIDFIPELSFFQKFKILLLKRRFYGLFSTIVIIKS